MKTLKSFILLILAIAVCLPGQTAIASVELLYFLALPGDHSITLIWETATELDNAGFYVQRGEDPGGSFSRISQFIPSLGDPFTGHYYSYIDTSALPGLLYYYVLEIVGADGLSEYSTIVSAMIGGPTTTPTLTLTQTPPVIAYQTATFTSTSEHT